jgi:hypothetical protein
MVITSGVLPPFVEHLVTSVTGVEGESPEDVGCQVAGFGVLA